ncbi:MULTISPECIES: hypothetical protein [Alteromonas]|jgi:hypothetical protein|uniref:hypothetical protein n=1 Tax=Alteromonas TaxID=226 RepID=UPI0008595314|nr:MULTISPECIES: hypothetical protein [Alteromonas]MBL3809648.1 hypothetical protein [Alteromonas macleodii]MBL3883185.1 hypothetical protein [Alteromonas macleodii]MCG7651343.1 hypothetical protein [Alteromonas sp. MmMcT2-5]
MKTQNVVIQWKWAAYCDFKQYRLATGSRQEKTQEKSIYLANLARKNEGNYSHLALIDGFGLHPVVFADTHQTEKLEHWCRYIERPSTYLIPKFSTKDQFTYLC